MKDVTLKEKIDELPENLKDQVSDYVDFLLYQYGKGNEPALTTEEKAELDNRWEAYQLGASSTSNLARL